MGAPREKTELRQEELLKRKQMRSKITGTEEKKMKKKKKRGRSKEEDSLTAFLLYRVKNGIFASTGSVVLSQML